MSGAGGRGGGCTGRTGQGSGSSRPGGTQSMLISWNPLWIEACSVCECLEFCVFSTKQILTQWHQSWRTGTSAGYAVLFRGSVALFQQLFDFPRGQAAELLIA